MGLSSDQNYSAQEKKLLHYSKVTQKIFQMKWKRILLMLRKAKINVSMKYPFASLLNKKILIFKTNCIYEEAFIFIFPLHLYVFACSNDRYSK